MLIKRFAAVIGILAVSTLAVPSTVQGGRMVERQFDAVYAGEYQPGADHECEDESHIKNLVLGEGVGSLIGHFEVRIEGCVDLSSTPPFPPRVYGTALYTAANGDLLGFEFDGFVVASDGVTTVAELPATAAFGDGRFANVELGSGPGMAVDTSVANTTSSGYVSGPIIYDASDRSGT